MSAPTSTMPDAIPVESLEDQSADPNESSRPEPTGPCVRCRLWTKGYLSTWRPKEGTFVRSFMCDECIEQVRTALHAEGIRFD